MAVIDSTALAAKEVNFVQQACNAVHFNQILYVLFFIETIYGKLEFFIPSQTAS